MIVLSASPGWGSICSLLFSTRQQQFIWCALHRLPRSTAAQSPRTSTPASQPECSFFSRTAPSSLERIWILRISPSRALLPLTSAPPTCDWCRPAEAGAATRMGGGMHERGGGESSPRARARRKACRSSPARPDPSCVLVTNCTMGFSGASHGTNAGGKCSGLLRQRSQPICPGSQRDRRTSTETNLAPVPQKALRGGIPRSFSL